MIAYVSRSLTRVERRYSQTEREALAIVWAVERLNTYLYGSSLTLYTDCKPIELILNNPRSKTSARIERWKLQLQDYCFHVVYTKGQQNPSDFLSRHTTDGSDTSQHEQSAERYVNFITYHSIPKAMTLDEIKVATCNDVTMQHLIAIRCNTQSWESLTKVTNTVPPNVNKADLLHFHRLRNELVVTDKENIVLRGSRMVLPQPLRSCAIEIAHEGHQGLVKTKMLLREKTWFPSIDELTKQLLDQCIPCQANGPDSGPDPLQMSPLPPEPWHMVNVEFCGPFPTGEYLLVVIDDYSRFPEVAVVQSTSAKATIPQLEKIFATHGIPHVIKSNNGPPFSSAEIRLFMDENGPVHKRITPLWLQANAPAENFMKPLTKAI